MSVAFRRESDEEHLEPKFELPIPPGPNLVTKRGYALVEARHDAIEAQLTSELTEDERKKVLREARYWRHQLASAQLAPIPDGATVSFGTRVTIIRDGTAHTLDIVGHDESDPASGRIAFTAPLARAMLGAEAGDEVEFAGSDTPVLVSGITVLDD
ncbi:MAG: GreA/GreB family elongation factor [Sphingomicrobium sp.]